MISAGTEAPAGALLFIDGLTVVSMIGTGLLILIFGFLYYAEQQVKNAEQQVQNKTK